MDTYTVLIPFLILGLSLPCLCLSRSWDPILKRIDRLDNDVNHLEMKVPAIVGRLENKVDIAREDLKEELMESIVPGYIEHKVDEYLADVLSRRGIKDLVSRSVAKRMNNLKNNLNQVKKQNIVLSNRLAFMEEEMRQMKNRFVTDVTETFRNVSQDGSKLTNGLNTTRLTLKKMKLENPQERNNLTSLNSLTPKTTYNSPTEGLAQNLTTSPPSTTVSSTVSVSRSAKTNVDLLLAPYWKSDSFKRLEFNSFKVSNVPPIWSRVNSVVYLSSLKSLLISHDSQISTINIDTREITMVKGRIRSVDMAVDEGRQLVFLTTFLDTNTISRMEISGWKYKKVIDTTSYGREAKRLAVDPEQQKIYACLFSELVSLDYSGHNVQTLYTAGKGVNGIALAGDSLYFSVGKLLMKHSLSNNVNKKLLSMNSMQFTIVHYNSTLYTLSFKGFGVINVGDENNVTVQYDLVKFDPAPYAMCLIPAEWD